MMSICVHVSGRKGRTDLNTSQPLQLSPGYAGVGGGGVEPLLNDTMSLARASLHAVPLPAKKKSTSFKHALRVWFHYFVFIWMSWASFIHPDSVDCAGES